MEGVCEWDCEVRLPLWMGESEQQQIAQRIPAWAHQLDAVRPICVCVCYHPLLEPAVSTWHGMLQRKSVPAFLYVRVPVQSAMSMQHGRHKKKREHMGAGLQRRRGQACASAVQAAAAPFGCRSTRAFGSIRLHSRPSCALRRSSSSVPRCPNARQRRTIAAGTFCATTQERPMQSVIALLSRTAHHRNASLHDVPDVFTLHFYVGRIICFIACGKQG